MSYKTVEKYLKNLNKNIEMDMIDISCNIHIKKLKASFSKAFCRNISNMIYTTNIIFCIAKIVLKKTAISAHLER